MAFVGQIYESLPESIRMPDSLKNRPVEVILAPLDKAPDTLDKRRKKRKLAYEFIGAWKGEALTMPEQANTRPESLWDNL